MTAAYLPLTLFVARDLERIRRHVQEDGMGNGGDFDAAAAWQKLIGNWERQFNELSGNISSSEGFSGSMSQTTKLNMAARKAFESSMEKWLATMQMPTHQQLEALSEKLDRIEEQVQAIAAVVLQESRHGPNPAVREPQRTRKPAPPAGKNR